MCKISSVIGEMSMSKLCEIQYVDQAREARWLVRAKSHVNSIRLHAPNWIGKQIKTVAGKIRAMGERLVPEGYQDATGFHPLK
jgi:poly(3-hydroxyalkanoate) synthetase